MDIFEKIIILILILISFSYNFIHYHVDNCGHFFNKKMNYKIRTQTKYYFIFTINYKLRFI